MMLVEKVSYSVNWKNFVVGSSFFIPCLNPAEAKKVIAQTTNRLKINVATKVSIEDGVRGLRLWRI